MLSNYVVVGEKSSLSVFTSRFCFIAVKYLVNYSLFRPHGAAGFAFRSCTLPNPESYGSAAQLCLHASYDFSIKWLTPFYPANPSQAAGGGEKCMDLRFLRLRRWLLKQQPNKTVFNRFIEN